MQSDQWGYPLATESAAAAAALNSGFNGYVGWRTDTIGHLNAAIEADPEFALPRVAKGILICGLKKPEMYPTARAELEAAQRGPAPASEREQRYIAALEAALDGRMAAMASQLEQIARAQPHDLFALRLTQFELFWLGEAAWMRDVSERAAPHWSADVPGYSAFLSIRAFGLEEAGSFAEAEACGREAVARDPADCWGTHAVAHALVMQGRLGDGVDWLTGLTGNWGGANHIVHHLWWHLALFHVERGEHAAALEIYDKRLRDPSSPLLQAIPDFHVDIQNDVALLQRLELRGVDVGERWQPIAELARARIGNHASPFTSAHCALALAAAGRDADAAELIRRMRAFIAEAEGDLGARYALAALPASEAAVAHRKGAHERVLELLVPARRSLWQMGGSHAQRDLFFQILADSAFKLQRRDVLATLFEELGAIGFDHLGERSSYADAVALLQ